MLYIQHCSNDLASAELCSVSRCHETSWGTQGRKKSKWVLDKYLTIRLRARVFYEQIVNKAQPSWLSLVENEGE